MQLDASLLGSWVSPSWVRVGEEAGRRRARRGGELLRTGSLPEEPWDEASVEALVDALAAMDANNYAGNVGAGEREGRVFAPLVRRRHFGLAHGMGRSGDVAATQPKAPGSSVIVRLTQSMALDLMRRVLGMRALQACAVLPLATGMALTLVLLAVAPPLPKPHAHAKRRVALWPRMDQKTCLKAMVSAGLDVRVVENLVKDDRVMCNVEAIAEMLAADALLPESEREIAVVVTTTSCFAPRVPDDVEAIAKLCHTQNVPHVINNAYGLQCNKIVHSLEQACRHGRVDAIVQSTDKNFLVPVGGSIVSSPREGVIEAVSKTYPGRASISPVLDLFITLLVMGRSGYEALRKERIALASNEFPAMLARVAQKHGLRVLASPRNTISFAVGLGPLERSSPSSPADGEQELDSKAMTELGSMLFLRGVSGARVVATGTSETVAGRTFVGYGSSCSAYPESYVTLACAMGMTPEDVRTLERRLDGALSDFVKQQTRRRSRVVEGAAGAVAAAAPPPPEPEPQREPQPGPVAVVTDP